MAQVLYYTLSFLVIISTLSNFLVFGETDSSGVDQLQFSISGKPKVPFLKSLLAWSNKQAAPVRGHDAKTTSNSIQPAQISYQGNSRNKEALLNALARKGYVAYFLKYCSVGVKDGRILDKDMSASSSSFNAEAKYARLDIRGIHRNQRDAWLPAGNETGEWLQVDFQKPTVITGLVIQGRDFNNQWVKTFKLSYGNFAKPLKYVLDKNGKEMVFRGSVNNRNYQFNRFDQPITARYIRFYPITWHSRVALRMEFINC